MEKTPKNDAGKKASEVVAICDHPNFNVESLIRTIRGQKVMLDFDLSMLYGVQNKRLNEQVKRNKERFPDDFMFQLTQEEWSILRSQIATTKQLDNEKNSNLKSQFATSSWGGVRKRPYAFTRNGIAMLSSVLRSETAVDVNIRIMRAFTSIPQIVNNNALMMQRILNVEMHQIETDEKVNQILKTIEANSPKLLNEKIFATGCVWDAWAYVSDLVRSAKQRIVLIDRVEAMIHSRYSESFLTDLHKHNVQQREIKFTQLPHRNHDRFLIIDDEVYLLGASVKDMGVGLCAITKMQTSPETVLGLLE